MLDASQDPDHNRAVVTFVAEPDDAVVAGCEAMRVARDSIDLRSHQGVHPRMGATDVFPFVPLEEGDMGVCVRAARDLARRAGDSLGIPIFLYGEAARLPERCALPAVRNLGFEALGERIRVDPCFEPDAGPRVLHPSAGATAIGARTILIAFNVDLETGEIEIARRIAREIRESNGGLPGVRALGLRLPGRARTQVSMNLCDPSRTNIAQAFDEVDGRAHRLGTRAFSSELIGLAPASALNEEVARHVLLEGGFQPSRVLEIALARS